MNSVYLLLGWNLVITAVLALGLWCLGWLPAMRRRPALRHGLWLLVLLKLVVPPLVPVPVLPAGPALVTADHALDTVAAADHPRARLGDASASRRASRSEPSETASSLPPVEGRSPVRRDAGILGLGWREALTLLVGVSLSVSAAIWLAALGQLRRVRRLLKNGPVQPGRVVELLDETARKFALRRVPRLVVADAAITPMLWAERGRPVIVLPEQLVGLVDEDRLRWIIGHELAHCLRRDHLANLLAFAVVSLFWWNPVAWLAWSELTSAAEAACDALALERLAGSRKAYAETLLAVIDFTSRANSRDLAIGVGFGRSRSLKTRFAMLAQRGVRPDVSRIGWGVVALAAVALTLLPAQAEDRPKPAPAPAAEPHPNGGLPPADAQATRPFDVNVVDEDVEAVAGADVWLRVYRRDDRREELVLAGRADAAGHFRFSVPEAWLTTQRLVAAWAVAPGHAVGVNMGDIPADKKIAAEALQVVLSPASDLSVVVTLPDGKPAVGAKLAPYWYEFETGGVVHVPSAVAEKIGAVTDHQGRARLFALARDRADRAEVVYQGYGRQLFSLDEEGHDPTQPLRTGHVVGEPKLRLWPAGRIEGRLIADQPELASGIPIKIETVVDLEKRPAADYWTAWGSAEVTTDADGRFAIPEIPEGRVMVTINLDAQLPVMPRIPDLELKGGGTLQLDIPLEKPVRVRGRVRVKDGGEPLEARVSLEYGPQQTETVTTDDKGNYSALVLPGSVRVFAEIGKEKYVDEHTVQFASVADVDYVDVEGQRGKSFALPKGVADFELPPIEAVPAIQVKGTLVDAQGKRLAGAEIRGSAGHLTSDPYSSDYQGDFWLGWFPVGTTFDSFSIRSGGQRFEGQAVAIDPLIVRVQPKGTKTEGKR